MANYFGDDTDCVALWKHESGGLPDDSIGGNDFTNTDVTADTTNYKEGAASGDYNGSTGYQYIADVNCDAGFPMKSGDTGKVISVCMWVRPHGTITSGYDGLIGKWGGAGARCWSIHLRGLAGGPYAGWYWSSNGTAYESGECTGIKLTANNWYHIGATYTDSTKAWRVRVWDDTGSTVYDNDSTGSNAIALNTQDLELGRGVSIDDFDGNIDEVVVFKRALSTVDIDKIRQGTFGVTPSAGPKLLMGVNF